MSLACNNIAWFKDLEIQNLIERTRLVFIEGNKQKIRASLEYNI